MTSSLNEFKVKVPNIIMMREFMRKAGKFNIIILEKYFPTDPSFSYALGLDIARGKVKVSFFIFIASL